MFVDGKLRECKQPTKTEKKLSAKYLTDDSLIDSLIAKVRIPENGE